MPLTPQPLDAQTAILHAAILKHSGHGIIATDVSGTITVFNRAAQAMLGYSDSELIGKATPTVFHLPSEVTARAAQFSKELQQDVAPGFDVFVIKTRLGLPNEHEWTYVRRDGSRFPVLLSITALQDESGQPVGFLGMAVDITERKRNEQLVAEREAQYRVLFQDNPNPMLLYDTESVRILAINAAAMQLYGYSEAELLDQHLNMLLPAFEHERLREVLALGSSSLRKYRWQHLRKNGELFTVDTVSKPAQIGKVRARMVLITDQRQALAALHESERRLVQVLHGNPVPTFVIDEQNQVVIWNPACERILGVRAQEMLGRKDVWRVFYPQPRPVMANLIVDGGDQTELVGYYGEACKRSYVNPDAFESEDFFPHMADGAGRWLHFCASPLRDGTGKVVGAIETLMDITEQKRAEERANRLNEDLEVRVLERTTQLAHANEELRNAMDQLVQAEKLASLGRLVAGVAHELNTPIGNMVMVASTLREVSEDFARSAADGSITRSAMAQFLEQNQDGTQLLLSNARRSAELIQNFKQVAVDQTTDQAREFDLADQICDVLSVMAHGLRAPITLQQDLQPGIAMYTFPGPLGQVITNLVMNAVLHGFDKGQAGTIRVACERIGQQAHISVHDNGQGIPAENLGKIFDPFFTTKLGQGGTGLGLHISHNIVHGPLGGRMSVQSTVGVGTTFTLVLPCIAQARTPA